MILYHEIPQKTSTFCPKIMRSSTDDFRSLPKGIGDSYVYCFNQRRTSRNNQFIWNPTRRSYYFIVQRVSIWTQKVCLFLPIFSKLPGVSLARWTPSIYIFTTSVAISWPLFHFLFSSHLAIYPSETPILFRTFRFNSLQLHPSHTSQCLPKHLSFRLR